MIKIFTVEFVNVEPEEFDLMCTFCEQEKSSWWCEWLGEGYCERCMKEQEKEYFKEGRP